MSELNIEVQKQVIRNRISMWKEGQYQAVIDHRVATKLNDENMKKNAKDTTERCEKALTELEEMLAELEAS